MAGSSSTTNTIPAGLPASKVRAADVAPFKSSRARARSAGSASRRARDSALVSMKAKYLRKALRVSAVSINDSSFVAIIHPRRNGISGIVPHLFRRGLTATISLGLTMVAVCMMGLPIEANDSVSVSRTVAVTAQIASSTSLKISTDVLTFVVGPDGSATASTDFVAAARIPRGGGVILSMEVAGDTEGVGRLAAFTFTSEAPGTRAGSLSRTGPTVIGEWVDSGRRSGRVDISVVGAAAGVHLVQVRFVLSTP